ncbi:MAG: Crp/Fnr family transcriptional regulator [Chitinophagaceae bacterium]|nr:Crp/Fnr family transcriptional regulator [Chitinophagaceae bacterium]
MEIEQLQQFISPVHSLNDKEWAAFSSIWGSFACKRKTVLTAAGETERHLYFVLEGVQRAFYIGEDQQEATIVFTYPPSFSGVADSFLTQTPTLFFFETLTASKFLRTTYKQVEILMNEYPAIQKLILKTTAFALKGVLARQVELQCYTAEEKFRTLLKRSPHLLQIIPHKYLASYVGIDPTTFSKLMGSVRL